MEIKKFFEDISDWILECNSQAAVLGFFNQEFWDWAVQSIAGLVEKYNNDPLAIAQEKMLLDWLEQTRKEALNGSD